MARMHFSKDAQYLLNRCTKYLARTNGDFRHTYSSDGLQRSADNIAEAWRFPIIDTYGGGALDAANPADFSDFNEVTFIYAGASDTTPRGVSVIGTFHNLYEPVPLERVMFQDEPSRYWAITFAVEK